MARAHGKSGAYYRITGNAPTTFHSQTMMELMVGERKWCDLYLYHPQLPSVIIRQTPDTEFFIKLESQLTTCVAERNIAYRLLQEGNSEQ